MNKIKHKTIYVDIDETICTSPGNCDYTKSQPFLEKIKMVNKLFDQKNIIVYWTARGTVTGIDWYDMTLEQLKKWNCKFHELKMGKPYFDLFIDDKALNSYEWTEKKLCERLSA